MKKRNTPLTYKRPCDVDFEGTPTAYGTYDGYEDPDLKWHKKLYSNNTNPLDKDEVPLIHPSPSEQLITELETEMDSLTLELRIMTHKYDQMVELCERMIVDLRKVSLEL